jgi:hypothetical protein
MTTWSFASSGGGGAGCAARSRVSFIPSTPSNPYRLRPGSQP